MRRYRRFAENHEFDRRAVQQPLICKRWSGCRKRWRQNAEPIDSPSDLRECAGDAGTLIEHAESLLDTITKGLTTAPRRWSTKARGTLQNEAPLT